MAAQFESFIHPFIIMFTVPLAAIGVIFTLLVSGKPLSIVVFIGVDLLAGIVVNNGIVLIDYINSCVETAWTARSHSSKRARVRLRPILMTTMTTVLGLLPMALGFGEGAEIRAPMALTVIGGLIGGTILTLLRDPVAVRRRGARGVGTRVRLHELSVRKPVLVMIGLISLLR